MTLANPRTAEAFRRRPDDRARLVAQSSPIDAAWPPSLLRAAEWAKERKRRRYLAAVKRRLRRFNPPPGP